MKIFLVILVRKKTKSILKIHIDAKDSDKASQYAKNTLDKNWSVRMIYSCLCPNEPYNITKDGLFWNINGRKFLLQHGSYRVKDITCTA